jgi:transglutaminase-like putative cysteine protease
VLALAATAALLVASVSVLYGIVDVDGEPWVVVALAAAAVISATVLARFVPVLVATVGAVLVLAAGMGWYLLSLPQDPQVGAILADNLELLTGKSLLEIRRSTVWGVAVTPAPVFVTWYLALRGWYAGAALAGGSLLGYLVLTGDAGLVATLAGVVGVGALVSFGDLDRRESSFGALESVAVVLAVMIVAPLVVTVVPGGASTPLSFDDGGGTDSVEATLLEAESTVAVRGDIELSPTVRYTVESPEKRYWRVSSYDRYTGTGWVRTGGETPYPEADLRYPPGSSRRFTQTFRAETPIDTMPAAWRPIAVDPDAASRTSVDSTGGLQPDRPLIAGENYTVTSAAPAVSERALAGSGSEYPDAIERRYLQLPASTPDRVRERTATITSEADDPYETTRLVRDWLLANRGYSLAVDRPEGSVADAFLFEMESGYCVYYATTMATMLRTQDIPARMTVGYTTGQPVGNDTYVVRGYNSHAWVEVYFEGVGWVPFDPTPAGPRVAAEQARLDEARLDGTGSVDTTRSRPLSTPDGTSPTTISADGETDASLTTPANPADRDDAFLPDSFTAPDSDSPPGGDTGAIRLPGVPSTAELAFGAVVVVGAVAGLRRSDLGERAYRAAWLRWQPRRDPGADIEESFQRLLYLLERRHRPRRTGETVQSYLDAVEADPRARRLATIRERARYAGEASEAAADEARTLLAALRGSSAENPATGGERS